MDIGVRKLEKHLSEILDCAAAGEIVRVTERVRPKAILGPMSGAAAWTVGVAEGWVRVGDGTPPAPVRRHSAAAPVLAVLAQDREDR